MQNLTGVIGSQDESYEVKFTDPNPVGRFIVLPTGQKVMLTDAEWAARRAIHQRTQIARCGAGVFRVLLLAFVPVMLVLMLLVVVFVPHIP